VERHADRASSGERVISRIHHVAIAVNDLDAGLAFWRDTLELPLLKSADVEDQGVRAALLACGAGELELVAPLTPDTGVARFLQSRGEGLHHLCFESDDVVREVRRFIGTGVDMIDGKPRQGLAGKVAFVQPRACAKILVELATPSEKMTLPPAPLALAAVHGKVEDVGAAAQRFQDLFGMSRGFAAEDLSFVQLSLSGLVLQLTPLGGGFAKPALTALRLQTKDLPALAHRLGERGVASQESAVGLVVAPGAGQGAPLIVEPGR
jgi:methylmalonyl-CoA/ethylmalonyl-CoA epimerase